jgi:hypothetical protein
MDIPTAKNASAQSIVLKWGHSLTQGKEFTRSIAMVKLGDGQISGARSKGKTQKSPGLPKQNGAWV